jgi:hypothetical protein
MGAAMAIIVDVTLGRKPDAQLIALVTAFCELPKRAESTCLPAEIKGELGSETALATPDHVVFPGSSLTA